MPESPSIPPKPAEEGEHQEETSEDEDDEPEEDEPQLKYERISGDLAKVVRGDLVSAVCIGSKRIVLTHSSRTKRSLGGRLAQRENISV